MLTFKKKALDIPSGVSIAYAEAGPENTDPETPVLLFVPGFTFPGDVFVHQLSGLSHRFRVIAIDPRSHGASTMASSGNDYDTHAQDLRAFIDALDLQNIVLTGWSFGALATWGYADLAGTGRLAAHISVDMPPVSLAPNGEQDMWVEGSVGDMAAAFGALTTADGHNAMIRDYISHVMVERDLTAAELDVIAGYSLQTPYPIAMQLFAAGLFSNRIETAKALEKEIPCHFFIADHWSGVATQYLKEVLPKSGTSAFGGHMMFWEYPDRFNAELTTFIEGL